MGKYIINGKKRLEGEITLQGAKNAALPIMAASVLCGEEVVLHNVPDITDVSIMKKILSSIGCFVKTEGNTLTIDPSNISDSVVSESLVSKMRSSIILLGSVLARTKKAKFSYPGGCDIGLRPIDMHLKGLKDLGAVITEEHGYIIADGKDLHSGNIHLNYPSVGATENLILASVFSKGVTAISNAAKEPEIVDLQYFLNKMGARIYGAGTNTVYIEGIKELHGCEYTIMSDRIVSPTYMCAVNMCGGDVFMRGASLDNIKSPYYKLIESGLDVTAFADGIRVRSDGKVSNLDSIISMPYPGFPTDLQPIFTAMLCLAEGTSIINETVFENRYRFTSQLKRMGADIKIEGRIALIRGVKSLSATRVYSEDLRGGAALTLAALCADGQSVVEDVEYIMRGYEDFHTNLEKIGSDIRYVPF
ncbi:MAG: UDP-N-acetylglucosamine 1-carboxyvinyltransferase [Eubacteriaceae bacterium]|nr:UDP-N-acetylglucosamine 1-carboxyvinyltransferase [Eubacteriaceae bacterium]